jgi:monoamine oxidase
MSKEVLIIGAGACGLIAGKLLSEKGYLVTILESRNRPGGRIFSDVKSFPTIAEYGAEFIHGDQPFTLTLARESDTALVELSGKWYEFREGKVQKSQMFDGHWEEMLAKLNTLDSDTDLGSFIEDNFSDPRYKDLREGVRKFVEGYDAADMNKVSAFALRDEWSESEEAKQYRLRDGYGKIINFLEDRIRENGGTILYSCVVNKVNWSPSKVTLETSDGKLVRGERVIITVPVGVLQKGAITFSPELPYRRDIFNKIGFGGVIKFLFEFSPLFWRDVVSTRFKDLAFILSDAEIPTWWVGADNACVLIGWWAGPSTLREKLGEEELLSKARQSLQYILDCGIEELQGAVAQAKVIDWVHDPFSAGAYAYAMVNSANARKTLGIPVDDTLYFAGEALYDGTAMGTVEAALVSGRDVARKISGLREDE